MKIASLFKRAAAAVLVSALAVSMAGCSQFKSYEPKLGEQKVPDSALISSKTLRVGVDAANSPMAGTSGGKIIGIDVDIASAIADYLGLAVEIIDVGTDGEKALTNKEVDIVMGINSTTKTEDWLSSQYIPAGIVLFNESNKQVEVPKSTDEVKIAAQVSSKSAWAVTNIFGDEALESATDLSAAFSELKGGSVNFVASDAIVGLYSAKRQGMSVDVCALLEPASGYCAMAPKDNSDISDAVNEAISKLKEQEIIYIIEKKWLGQVLNLDGLAKIEGQKASTTNVDNPDGEGEEGNESSSSSSSSAASSSSSGTSSSKSSSSGSTSSSSKSSSARSS